MMKVVLMLLYMMICCISIPLKVKLFTKLSSASPALSSITSPALSPITSSLSNNIEITKPLKLPIWPVYSGVIAQIFDWLGLHDLSEAVVSKVGGRVIPITLANSLDPFLLLVHHAHSFMPFDIIRPLQKLFIQEGFPSHPHSGFDTVTITLESGLRHRDDQGIIQSYSDGDIQWMRAGRGTIHEERWDLFESNKKNQFKRFELYQLWVNLPAARKDDEPIVNLIKANELKFIDINENVKVQVICGDVSYGNEHDSSIKGPGNVMCESNISIMQVNLSPNSELIINTDKQAYLTIFVRRGSLVTDQGEAIYGNVIKINSNSKSQDLVANIVSGSRGLDALLLLGKPLNEPCLFQGSFVQSDQKKLMRSYKVFSDMGMFWDHSVNDSDYLDHVNTIRLQDRIKKEINLEIENERYM